MARGLPGLPRLARGSATLPRLPDLAGKQMGRRPRAQVGLPTIGEVEERRPWDNPPGDWPGSPAEWAIFWAHQFASPERGPHGVRWVYQVPLFGRWTIAGFVPDFTEYDVRITININDEGLDPSLERLRALVVASFRPPFTHIVIDGDHARQNPVWYLNEALAGRSHSALGPLL